MENSQYLAMEEQLHDQSHHAHENRLHEIKIQPNYRDQDKAHIQSFQQYKEMYDYSIQQPEKFWAEQAEIIDWFKKPQQIMEYDFNKPDIKFYEDGVLNACYNCLDTHIKNGRGDNKALIWEGNDPSEDKSFTYRELLSQVNKVANILKKYQIQKGDRVTIYMQMIPELIISMLACARIGAVHSIVFGGFSSQSLSDRINDSQCKLILTQDTGVRGLKQDIPMKASVDKACQNNSCVEKVVVVKRTGTKVEMKEDRDIWYHDEIEKVNDQCEPEQMNAEDPLFILYTSGSTGKPKGVLHTTGGYLVQTALSHKFSFDYQQGDIYWCTADIGWITGHSYVTYGPLINGAIILIFEGVPNYPNFDRFWQVVQKHKVNILYTAPTALRALMREGNDHVLKCDRSSLKILGTVGEPIKEKEWTWYFEVVGESRCPVIDTYWQTETGSHLITNLPSCIPMKKGSCTLPFFGIQPVLLDQHNNEIQEPEAEGYLCMKGAWPSMMRTLYGDHKKFYDIYFSLHKGYYFTGDGAKRDSDGYYWIIGRVDDVINVSGHRLGTAEIEGAIGRHPDVAEAAVVGMPHEIKGQGIYVYITLMQGKEATKATIQGITQCVRDTIGPIATPDKIQITNGLPKTRSGKIMRRILRKIAEGEIDNLGDLSTLADPSIVDLIIKGRQ